MHCEYWCLINVFSLAFCEIYWKCTFWCFIQIYLVYSDMKCWEQLFLHEATYDCFFLCQESCVYAKITVFTRFEYLFIDSPWLIMRIADFINFGHVTLNFNNCNKFEKWLHKSSSLSHKWKLLMKVSTLSHNLQM